MGPHEVVNGANGSVTWCQGPPFCPQCVQGARAHERPIQIHCPGCRCSESGSLRERLAPNIAPVRRLSTSPIEPGHVRIIGV